MVWLCQRTLLSAILLLSGCNLTTLDDPFSAQIAVIEFVLSLLVAMVLSALLLGALIGFMGLLGAIGIQLRPTPRMRAFASGIGAVMLVTGGGLLLFWTETTAEPPEPELAVEFIDYDDGTLSNGSEEAAGNGTPEVPTEGLAGLPAEEAAEAMAEDAKSPIDPSVAFGGACSLFGCGNIVFAMGLIRRRRRSEGRS